MNACFVRHKLKAVTITCCNNALVSVFFTSLGERTENIVSLKALAGNKLIA